MKSRKNHFPIGRTGITQSVKEQVVNIPNQPVMNSDQPLRHREPIRIEEFKEKKKKSKYQRQ
jgi:hypothetical protein